VRFGPSYDIPLILRRMRCVAVRITVQALAYSQLVLNAPLLRDRPGGP